MAKFGIALSQEVPSQFATILLQYEFLLPANFIDLSAVLLYIPRVGLTGLYIVAAVEILLVSFPAFAQSRSTSATVAGFRVIAEDGRSRRSIFEGLKPSIMAAQALRERMGVTPCRGTTTPSATDV